MLIKDIMTKHTDCLNSHSTLAEASYEMRNHDWGFLPVKDNGKLAGVVTDRDITIRGVAANCNPSTTLDKVMTKHVFTIHEDDDVKEAAKLMTSKKVRRLVVLNKKEDVAGIVSLSDIGAKCREIDLSKEIFKALSETSH